MGGLGIPDLRSLNLSLLASWIFIYQLHRNAICIKIVDHKYRTNAPNLFCCPEVGSSPFWKGVLWTAQTALMGIRWVVGDGCKISFWEDQWIGNTSLAIAYWPLYVINEQHGNTISQVWDEQELKLSFRRNMSESLMNLWLELCSLIEETSLGDGEDQIL